MRVGAVVVASGRGFFRLVGGIRFPKVMEEIGGEPMVSRVVRAVMEAGIGSVIVVVNPVFGLAIETALATFGFNSCKYVVQPRRRGAAEALMRAMPLLRKEGVTDFLAIYADMPLWTAETIASLVDLHHRDKPLLSMTTVTLNGMHPPELERYGRVIRDSGDAIRYIVEPANRTPEELAACTVNPSLWIWGREWFTKYAPDVIPVHREDGFEPEQYVPPLVATAAKQRQIAEFSLKDPWEALGVNTMQELALVRHINHTRTISGTLDGLGRQKIWTITVPEADSI